MTNQHVIEDSSVFYVRRNGLGREFRAQVYEATPDLDLAVLTVDDEAFWKGGLYLDVKTKKAPKKKFP